MQSKLQDKYELHDSTQAAIDTLGRKCQGVTKYGHLELTTTDIGRAQLSAKSANPTIRQLARGLFLVVEAHTLMDYKSYSCRKKEKAPHTKT